MTIKDPALNEIFDLDYCETAEIEIIGAERTRGVTDASQNADGE